MIVGSKLEQYVGHRIFSCKCHSTGFTTIMYSVSNNNLELEPKMFLLHGCLEYTYHLHVKPYQHKVYF